MMLIGMYDSPFVRPVAISMKVLGIAFEHANWSVGRDLERIREFNPLGRVPTLVLDDGTSLIETFAILDHLDELVGPERALLPAAGNARRDAMQIVAITNGALEKAREQINERIWRPADKRHPPWVERCRAQMHGALTELERRCAARGVGNWLVDGRMTRADIMLACAFTFLPESVGLTGKEAAPYPSARALAERCEALPEFESTRLAWSAPLTG
jgi:glutathione S-transferase